MIRLDHIYAIILVEGVGTGRSAAATKFQRDGFSFGSNRGLRHNGLIQQLDDMPQQSVNSLAGSRRDEKYGTWFGFPRCWSGRSGFGCRCSRFNGRQYLLLQFPLPSPNLRYIYLVYGYDLRLFRESWVKLPQLFVNHVVVSNRVLGQAVQDVDVYSGSFRVP